jgi:dienelactone hydrolase
MSFLFAALLMMPLAFPTSEIIDSVTCARDGSQSYALYLPSNYTPEKNWPILLALDPGAHGGMPLRVFRRAAEEYGYILVGSNNSKNGPMDVAIHALVEMWEDARKRFSIDRDRVYAVGFSGGVRVAGKFAQVSGEVAAVIGCGAGFDIEDSKAKIPFAFVGVCGNQDMNYMWLQTLNAKLLEKKASSRVVLFEGEHRWPPVMICRQAIQWVELASYRRGRRPLDEMLVEELFQSERSRAAELEKAGNFFQSYLVQLDLRSDFEGIHSLDEVKSSIKELVGTERLRNSWKKAQELEQEESRYLKEILAEFLDTKRRRKPEWWKKKIENINSLGKGKIDPNRQLMVTRLIDSLWRNGYERAWLATLEQDYETAVYFAEVAALVLPDSSEVLYNLARMYAFNSQRADALETLQCAVHAGLKNVQRIEKDEAFNDLRLLPKFVQILVRPQNADPEE